SPSLVQVGIAGVAEALEGLPQASSPQRLDGRLRTTRALGARRAGRKFLAQVGKLAQPRDGQLAAGHAPFPLGVRRRDLALQGARAQHLHDPARALDLLELRPRLAGDLLGEALDVERPACGIEDVMDLRLVEQDTPDVARQTPTESVGDAEGGVDTT